MSDDVLRDLQYLHDLRSRGLSDEEITRALLDLTLQAAPPEVADAVRVCALPAWFDADLLALLITTPSPIQHFLAKIRRAFRAKTARKIVVSDRNKRKAAALLERMHRSTTPTRLAALGCSRLSAATTSGFAVTR